MLKSLVVKWIERYQNKGGGRQFAVSCNYQPTCSQYTKQAIEHYGLYQGLKIGFKRLRRCNKPDLIKPIYDPLLKPLPISELTTGAEDVTSNSTRVE
ncbi:MAG: alpha-hemolysin [Gammaproteobacteria bacterium]|nr:MAG: alpha-hemolysin [Gammaproteobacteria bacterium]